ncbi:phosphoglyceromutase [Candidatus Roizmanbacteria bacterium RIFOXYB2_FULL_38_10]|uniref:2,3-bisphosphoglycerate-dependent phosphoglycerate mutase n=1 Tax=Candidatus Roizmanbacteria bacterium RIFOXYD1_FULL_38_12 TaxID=1802093 RepID=A0A1F7L217_9BACT|nr:MAG: phosphoglyceromutase [Candidatus Roizmanbacteria bacterium RIFOXYA2_FULL_38_14]OGK64113.1 MAG: phosphoglyceromutase [Candidatus Roizmanbacteria bacterium RIFOXYA1_FULL_37_12]OGK65959.1 MAG: phosphoglyceromutase [Candidatus Roizmanbacteria bacterium RIFOXYB1_FULL_40_23]OGK68407.1 MAG: phosphoglyceromutase [Candidatus Roizmanbacteria bacterium RIFOXYB2_FULL_38_10]OGK70364.1 MAG: phosphoglyceromutase [Candidatus Roizmanbacteria bacterium RIFOXYC1_FULL_38_14]OGK74106.1 MAG: phosphoglycerom
MYKIVLVRHGITEWATRFTGWTDIDVMPSGLEDTKKYGKRLKELGYAFDLAYTSYLKRAIRTLWVVLDEMDLLWIPMIKHWRLNERHYGALQGLNKAETAAKYGEDQVLIWRRSYDTSPPKLEASDKRHPSNDIKYRAVDPTLLPTGESLKDTIDRFLPFWKEEVEPMIKAGKKIILSLHSNTLRALIKHLENLSPQEIMKVNVPYGIPLVYELDNNLKVIKHYYLAPNEEVNRVIESIKNQAKK